MDFSIMTEPQVGGTYDQFLTLARLADSEGLHSFARSDHYYWGKEPKPEATDAFAMMGGLARETERVRLTVLVSPLTFRHPAVMAKSAATFDQMSGGRFDLGVGTGWMEDEHTAFGLDLPPLSERFARLEEALDYLGAAFAEGHGSFEGDYYRLDATVEPTPKDVRLIVGGGGPKRTPALAGRKAHEYNTFIKPPEEVASRVRVMREAANGRSVSVTAMGPALVGRTESEYRDRLASAAAGRDMTPEDLEERYRSAGIPVGLPEQAAETIAALEEAGVERLYVQWLDPSDVEGLATTLEVLRSG